jgi:hypothetical protein
MTPTNMERPMAKFLFLYRVSSGVAETMPPAERERMMQKWRDWLGEGRQQGWLLDPGDKLKAERRIVNSAKVVTDGPFAESKEVIGGFSIVQAETVDAAAELAKSCPALLVGGMVEVGPLEGIDINRKEN